MSAWGVQNKKPGAKHSALQKQLTDMGFRKEDAEAALTQAKGNLSVATQILLGDTAPMGVADSGSSSSRGANGGSGNDAQGMISVSGNDKAAARASARGEAIRERHQRFMSYFKVHKCKEKLDRNHDKRMCFNWHTKADRRRNPFEVPYSCSECPQYAENDTCEDGDNCMKAHNMLERMFHPDLFKISMCQKPHSCERGDMCAFAHSEEDQRVAPPKTAGLAYNATSAQASLGAYLPNANAATSSSSSSSSSPTSSTRASTNSAAEKPGSKPLRGANGASSTLASSISGAEQLMTGIRDGFAEVKDASTLPITVSDSDGVVKDTQQKLVALITAQGSSGIISSELPKRYKEAYNENLVLHDEKKVSFRIKDLLLSQPGISMTMHKGVQPKYVYNPHQQQTIKRAGELLSLSGGTSPSQVASSESINEDTDHMSSGGLGAFPYLDGDVDVDAIASAILRGEEPVLHHSPAISSDVGDVNDEGSLSSLTGASESWHRLGSSSVIGGSASTRRRGPSSSSPLTLSGGLGALDAPLPPPQGFPTVNGRPPAHPPVDGHSPFAFGVPGGAPDASAFGANSSNRRRRGPDLPGSAPISGDMNSGVNEMPGGHLGELSGLGGALGVGPGPSAVPGLETFTDFSNPHNSGMDMNGPIFGLDMGAGITANMPEVGRDMMSSAREEQLAIENNAASNMIAELNVKTSEYERRLATVVLEKEKILSEWKKLIGQTARMQKVVITKDAEIAKLETICAETSKLLQQSEEHQRARLVPELKALQAHIGIVTHDLEGAHTSLEAKNIACDKLVAEHELALLKVKQESIKTKEESAKQLADLKAKNRKLQEEKEDLALENADLSGQLDSLSKDTGVSKDQGAMTEVRNCSLPGCNEAGVFRCMKCKKVSYCGQEHQKQHWKVHKKNCGSTE